jgi:hypothetical protein
VIYQIDAGKRRLLWVGPRRTQATLRRGLQALGPPVVGALRFVCSDLWKPYLKVVAKMAGQALHVVDRFHVMMNLNRAVDQVRRAESARLRGKPVAAHLKKMRWKLLRRGTRVRVGLVVGVAGAEQLATGRAWASSLQHLWRYRSVHWAGGSSTTGDNMRSRLNR